MKLSMKKIGASILRVGSALVVIWFGVQQISSPTDWIAYLPGWAAQLPISQLSLIYINGWFEIVAGTMLFFGIYTRAIALLIALHLAEITYTVGYDAIGIRDFGLFIATLSVFFHGTSPLSVDMFFTDDTPSITSPVSESVIMQQPVQSSSQNYFAKLDQRSVGSIGQINNKL